ncbi:MAG: chain-length determining protein [Rubellimicrobium sp.]|nr:chain-length determining protein [Rubellimicrobium sp.]
MGPIASASELRDALRRRAWIIALVLLTGMPAMLWIVWNLPRMYEATGVIQIEAPVIPDAVAGPLGGNSANHQLDLIQQKMFARDNIVSIIETFDLFPSDMPMQEQIGLLRQAITVVRLVDPAQSWRPDVQPLGLSITTRLGDPEQVADVTNALLEGIMDEARRRSEGRATVTLDFMTAEEARVASDVTAVEAEIARFREVNVDSLPEITGEQRSRLNTLTDALIGIEREIIALQTATDRLRVEDAARQLEQLTQQRALIAASVAATEAALAAAPAVERELGALNRTLDLLETELAVLTARRTEAAMNQLIESQDQAQRFEILERALVPDYPVSTSRRKLALAGAVAVTGLALGVALLIEFLSPRIRTAEQMQRHLGVNPVIVIPVLRRPGLLRRRNLTLAALLLGLGAAIWGLLATGGRTLADLIGSLMPRQAGPARNVPGE